MMKHRTGMDNFLATDIYGITAEEYSLGRGNAEIVKLMLAAGIKVIQYREKNKDDRQMYQECLVLREMCSQAGATFIVNDRVDLALLVEADGVHIGQNDLPPEKIRQLVGRDMIIGLSTHSPEQAHAAAGLGDVIDYIGVGPIFTTNTKKDVCHAVGLTYLEYVARNITVPFVAIGGIKEHNIAAVRQSGAKTIALVTEITGAVDLSAKVRALRAILAENEGRL